MKNHFIYCILSWVFCILIFTINAATPIMQPWFEQDYSKFKPKTWKDSKGTWTRSSGDKSVYNSETKSIQLDTYGGEVSFVPQTTSNPSRPAQVDVKMMFEETSPVDMLPDTSAQASVVLQVTDNNGLTFAGWTNNGWVQLKAEGVTAATNVFFQVRVILDHSFTPAKVQYLVNNIICKDAQGNEVFDSASSSAKAYVSEICFEGRGEVGEFSGDHYPTSAFEFTYSPQAVDEECKLNVVTNLVPNGKVNYQWFLGGKNKSWATQPFSTLANPVLSASMCENWIRVKATDDDGDLGETTFFFSRLPVAYITTNDGVNPSSSKEEHTGTLYLQGNGQWPDQYQGGMTIHTRGNSTRGFVKKPYKIKLDDKTNLFNFGKNKHWVLLANYIDVSLMRNTIAAYVSEQLGLTTMQTTWVDVILNGEYVGNYQLCEHIRVGSTRVDVYDWEDAAETLAGKFATKYALSETQEDALIDQLQQNLSWVTSGEVSFNGITDNATSLWKKYSNDITGGYLFELSDEYDAQSKFVVNVGNLYLKIMVSAPEYLRTNPTMFYAVSNFWQNTANAWISADGYLSTGECWQDLVDVDSMAGYWLVIEILGNNDAVYKSRYAYKDQGGKMFFGPVWDFDWGCGSTVVGGTETNPQGWKVVKSSNTANFYREWGDEPYFALVLWEKYKALRPYLTELLKTDGIYDQACAYILESGRADSEKWLSSNSYRLNYTWDTDSTWFKTYLTKRVEWIDTQFASIQTLMNSIKCSSYKPYTRCAVEKLSPTFVNGRVKNNSLETDVVDVIVTKGEDINLHVTSTSTATRTITAYVNGRKVATENLVSQVCDFVLPNSVLRPEGKRNIVDLIGCNQNGEVTYRTWALVTQQGGLRIILCSK